MGLSRCLNTPLPSPPTTGLKYVCVRSSSINTYIHCDPAADTDIVFHILELRVCLLLSTRVSVESVVSLSLDLYKLQGRIHKI